MLAEAMLLHGAAFILESVRHYPVQPAEGGGLALEPGRDGRLGIPSCVAHVGTST